MSKIIRDPLHDLIRVDSPHALKLIDSQPMQRLRKIRQLGLAWLVFPGAEHSRFIHSLGVFHLANVAMDYINRIQRPSSSEPFFAKENQETVSLAALVHDIGHGPFSHLFERVAREELQDSEFSHEKWTIRILEEHPEINQTLKGVGSETLEIIKSILSHTHTPRYMGDLVSSQLDVDRFDYLLRDSLMTGAKYSNFDLAWMLRILKVGNYQVDESNNNPHMAQVLAVDGSRGLSWVELHLLGRHYMYKNVYYHKTIRSAEAMLKAIISRLIRVVQNGVYKNTAHPVIRSLGEKRQPTLREYLSLNDFHILAWIEDWSEKCEDEILGDLSSRLHKRNIFSSITIPDSINHRDYADKRARAREFLEKENMDPKYYLLEDQPNDIAFKDYYYAFRTGKIPQEIYFLEEGRIAKPLSSYGGLLTQAK